jgi:hypothetical protein
VLSRRSVREQVVWIKASLKAVWVMVRLIASGVNPQFFLRLFSRADTLRWFESARTGRPLSPSVEVCPWYTFAALHFLRTRDFTGLHIFEYGSGNSTLSWSKVAATVTSVEHDRQWFEIVEPQLGPNVTYIFRDLVPGGDYCQEITRHGKLFDVVVVDGRDRVNCAKATIPALSPRGVIIWDNSDRERYAEGIDALLQAGFRRLDFSGFGPVTSELSTTSIFYRDGNYLGI